MMKFFRTLTSITCPLTPRSSVYHPPCGYASKMRSLHTLQNSKQVSENRVFSSFLIFFVIYVPSIPSIVPATHHPPLPTRSFFFCIFHIYIVNLIFTFVILFSQCVCNYTFRSPGMGLQIFFFFFLFIFSLANVFTYTFVTIVM